MEQVTFTYISTKCENCRFDFYILKNIMFVVSNFNTEKQCVLCGYDEDWLSIIKDRGHWEYFHNKIATSKYQQGNPFSEMERKCFEQMVNTIKQKPSDELIEDNSPTAQIAKFRNGFTDLIKKTDCTLAIINNMGAPDTLLIEHIPSKTRESI